jgi:hypothetical protein
MFQFMKVHFRWKYITDASVLKMQQLSSKMPYPQKNNIQHVHSHELWFGPQKLVQKHNKKVIQCWNIQSWRVSKGRSCHKAGIVPPTHLLATCFMLVSGIPNPSTLKMEAVCSSKTSRGFQWTTGHYIPLGWTLHNYQC